MLVKLNNFRKKAGKTTSPNSTTLLRCQVLAGSVMFPDVQ